jgi:phosphoglycolate phosphatase
MSERLASFKPSVVLFDLDGTLVDSVPDLAQAVDWMLAELQREPAGEARVRGWVGNGAPMLVKRALCSGMDPDEVSPCGARKAEAPVFDRALSLFYSAYGRCATQNSQLYPGALDYLEALAEQGIPMGLVTNKPERFTLTMLNDYDLARFFPLVLGGDSLPQQKPDPEPLLHAARFFGIDPGQGMMVGDSRHDIRAAQAAGMPVAAVTYGYNHGEPVSASGPDWVVDSLTELL